MGLVLLVTALKIGSCRKERSDVNARIQISLDNLIVHTDAVIPGAIYTDAFFTSENTGYAISNEGMIIKTTDGGKHWDPLPSPASFMLREIQFTDTQTGYIIGGDSTGSWLLKTSNAGDDWTKINLNSPSGGSPTGIFFLNSSTGFITGPGFFLKTINGGADWTAVPGSGAAAFNDVKFNTPHTGIATTSQGAYYLTTDGGNSWMRQESGTSEALEKVYFAGTATYVRSGNKLLNIYTDNAGNTVPAAVHTLYYLDANTCVGIGQHYESGFWPYGDIFITNGNWATSSSKKFTPDEAMSFSVIARMSERKIIMLGTGHLKTTVVTLEY